MQRIRAIIMSNTKRQNQIKQCQRMYLLPLSIAIFCLTGLATDEHLAASVKAVATDNKSYIPDEDFALLQNSYSIVGFSEHQLQDTLSKEWYHMADMWTALDLYDIVCFHCGAVFPDSRNMLTEDHQASKRIRGLVSIESILADCYKNSRTPGANHADNIFYNIVFHEFMCKYGDLDIQKLYLKQRPVDNYRAQIMLTTNPTYALKYKNQFFGEG